MAKVYRKAAIEAARIAGRHPEMDEGAALVREAIEELAAGHVKTGAYMKSIESGEVDGPKGVTDRAVWTDDPNALSIEFGHMQGDRHIPGLLIFNRAADRFR